MADIEPVEATKIKPGSTVTVEMRFLQYSEINPSIAHVMFSDNGRRVWIEQQHIESLPWLPSAPVLRVGGMAAVSGLIVRNGLPETVEVRAIDGAWAMVKWVDGACSARRVSDLTPLEDEG